MLAAIIFLVSSGLSAGQSPAASPCIATPEERGMDSRVLARMFQGLRTESKGLHSLLVLRNGCLVAEAYWPPWSREQKHYLNSATKAVLGALVGIAIHDGKLSEKATVPAFFPEYAPANTDPRKKRITVRHLLTMSSGISWPQTARENASDEMGKTSDWVRFILERPMAAEPGAVVNYSNGDSHLLSAVFQKATGVTAFYFAKKRLFAPLGIQGAAWDADPQGRSIGSAALQLRPIDMARLGTLYLEHGEADGAQIVPRDWIERSWTRQVGMPARGGPVDYGYYWWLYPDRKLVEAWGGAGQRIAVFRDLGLVVVMTADIPEDVPRSPLAAHLYDAIRDSVKSSGALPANPAAAADLERAITELSQR